MSIHYKHMETKLIHAGEPEPHIQGAVSIPVFQSSTFEYSGHEVRYIRASNTPNHIALHKKLAAVENAEDAIVAASGMAAISTALLTFLTRAIIFWPRIACTVALMTLLPKIWFHWEYHLIS